MEEIIDSEKNALGISDFLKTAKEYTETVFPDLNLDDLFTNSINGNISGNFIIDSIKKLLGTEFQIAIRLMVSVLIIIIIHSIFRAITENLENGASSKIVYFVQYLIIVTLITNTFVKVLNITKNSITSIVDFMNLLIPLMLTLMLTTGNITTTSVVQPLILFITNFIGNFLNDFIIPLLLISITLSIISNVSEKIQIDKLSKFLKSGIVWVLGIVLTIFTALLSIEGTLSSSVDGVTSKTAKAIISNFIPVVGKIMGDTAETVIGCGNILKNAVGIIGVIIIAGIILSPLIKVVCLWVAFSLTSALCEVVGDEKIVKLISQIADSYKVVLAILLSVGIMFIVGITLVLKITNSTLMYR